MSGVRLWFFSSVACFASCAALSPAPALFPDSRSVVDLNFEADSLNRPPKGLEVRANGRWVVADSPQAVSGAQVVVRRGDRPSVLALLDESERVGGEVSVRVLLGPSGAGLACASGEDGGYRLEADPQGGRVALYRGWGEETEEVAAKAVPLRKGEWARLGLVCDEGGVTAFFDGRALLRQRGAAGRTRLALWADGGVTAQFDDLRYVVGGRQTP